MRQFIFGFLGVTLVLAGAWIKGFDFDTRGDEALFIYMMCITAAMIGIAFFEITRGGK